MHREAMGFEPAKQFIAAVCYADSGNKGESRL
jgi:hypothetical protein